MKTSNELHTAFKMLDKDQDGFISKEDLLIAYRGFDSATSIKDIDEVFKQYLVGSAGIDFTTFCSIANSKRFSEANLESDLMEAFNIFDRDDNQVIRAEDLRNIFKKFCTTLNPTEVDQMIKEIDENGDGNIDFMEFINMILMK
jgi:Ca2+-binding EF-hand superfamily protein